ncbi:hypothetical protein C8F01DRAFT_1177751 [Mycena amicta]|nr:hypothetical protein C8F01DRAFT_1177751 [Mycena amicta]
MDNDTLQADIRIVFYIKVAFLAVLIYDTLLQLNEEYLHIWRSRWSVIKTLYLWTRYGTFIGAAGPLIHALRKGTTGVCDELTMFTTVFSLFGIAITQMILMIRTYTLYERSKGLLAFFGLIWFTIIALTLVFGVRWARSFTTPNALLVAEDASNACYFSTPHTISAGLFEYWALLLVETTIFLLTVWKVCRNFSDKRGLLPSLYRDGVWFYLAILPFTITSIVCIYQAPRGLSEIFDTPVQVMHSILVCRLITHTRAVAAEDAAREALVNKGFPAGYMNSRTRTMSSNYAKLQQRSDSDEVLDISPHA